MSPSPGGRRRVVGVQFRRSLLATAAAAIVLAVGAGGAQAVGGELDPSFGSGGIVSSFSGGAFSAVAVQPDGKIVAAGSIGAKGSNFALRRYTSSGKLDRSFGAGGQVLTNFGGDSGASALVVQADGKIVASAGGSVHDFALVRYTTTGSWMRASAGVAKC